MTCSAFLLTAQITAVHSENAKSHICMAMAYCASQLPTSPQHAQEPMLTSCG